MLHKPRIGKSLSKTDEAKLVHGLRVLRDAGIISPKHITGVSAQRYFYGVGPGGADLSAIDLVNKYQSLISGRAVAVPISKLSDEDLKDNKRLYDKAGGGKFIIVDHGPDETVKVVKGKVVLTHPAGIERIQVPIKFQNLEQWLLDFQKEIPRLEKERHGHAMFAFRFYGGSSQPYNTLSAMFQDLIGYKTLQESITRGDTKLQREIFRNLEIIIVQNSGTWFRAKHAIEDKKKAARKETAKKKAARKKTAKNKVVTKRRK